MGSLKKSFLKASQIFDSKVLHPFHEKSKHWKIREKLVKILPKDIAATLPHNLDPMSLMEWVSLSFQRRGWRPYVKILTLVLCSYFLADLSALLVEKFIPEPPPARPVRFREDRQKARMIESYSPIFARNLFNSQGIIPGDTAGNGPVDASSPPIRTTLPFNLIGTLILRDEIKSIATIEDKSQSLVIPVRVEDEIPSKIRILKIEARKVIFLNLSSNRREFIDLPEDANATNPRITLSSPTKGPGVEKLAPTQYAITRGEVDKALGNLNEILTQARCLPNFKQGMPAGYRCFQIVPGSIYDKLGMHNDDVIIKINGQDLSDPGQAFQQLSSLKESNHFEMQVERNGRPLSFVYDIH